MVGRNYVPSGLVSVSRANIQGGGYVRRSIIGDLAAMAAAARNARAPLRVMSAYRSWSQQRSLYQRKIDQYGLKVGRESVARPGHSEHQLGTTIDFTSGGSSKSYVGREMAANVRASGLTSREYLWRHHH